MAIVLLKDHRVKLDMLWRPIDIIACHALGKYFVGADSIDEVLMIGESLKKQGYEVTYNLLGEHVKNERDVGSAVRTMNSLISKMNFDNSGNISCKPTLFGLAISKDLFRNKIGQVIEFAHNIGIETEFDAENYEYIRDTFEVFSYFASVPVLRDSVRQAVQAHLKNIIPLMDKNNLWDKNLRIVNGSGVYDDLSEVCETREDKIKQRYFEILRRNIENRMIPFVATVRDRNLAESIIKITGDGEYRFEFQMLYGPLGRRLGKKLLSRGYPVRIYLPFVVDWCRDVWKPYGLRRAQMMRNIMWEEVKDKFGGKRR